MMLNVNTSKLSEQIANLMGEVNEVAELLGGNA